MDTYGSFVWEPSLVKTNAITAATEAACLVSCRVFQKKNKKGFCLLVSFMSKVLSMLVHGNDLHKAAMPPNYA